jgi:predicted GNAT family acetyltransferase
MSPVARSFPITVVDVPAADRYELLVNGELAASANYTLAPADRKIVFTFTELQPGFEGRGLGLQLATAVLDDVRRRDLVVGAQCAFFSTFIEDNPGYGDLLDPPLADRVPVLRVAGG